VAVIVLPIEGAVMADDLLVALACGVAMVGAALHAWRCR